MARVEVIVRCRPQLPSEIDRDCTALATASQNGVVTVSLKSDDSDVLRNKVYQFDGALDSSCSQDDVFKRVEHTIERVLDGFHATIFAYGQTGSGKTHTMEGFDYRLETGGKGPTPQVKSTKRSQWGIIPRAIEAVFNGAAERTKKDACIRYRVRCSYIQLYSERVYDLLNPASTSTIVGGGQGLKVRWNKKDEFYLENLFVFECDTPDQARDHFASGVAHKVMGSHRLNRQSSRSHCVYTLHVEMTNANNPDSVIRSKLSLVDLAGSERVANLDTNPSTRLFKESIDINRSLFALGKVISALAAAEYSGNAQHVPYRESKLTQLLKHSLGGNSHTLMIACVSPLDDYLEENINTLQYASKARCIQNTPIINEDPKDALIRKLQDEIGSLKKELNDIRALYLTVTGGGGAESSAADAGSFPPSLVQDLSSVLGDGGEKSQNNSDSHMSSKSSALMSPQKLREEQQALLALSGSPKSHNALLSVAARGDKDKEGSEGFLASKLLDSIRILREVVEINGNLRTSFDALQNEKLGLEKQVTLLMDENTKLRERVEILESLVVSAPPTPMEVLPPQTTTSVGGKNRITFKEGAPRSSIPSMTTREGAVARSSIAAEPSQPQPRPRPSGQKSSSSHQQHSSASKITLDISPKRKAPSTQAAAAKHQQQDFEVDLGDLDSRLMSVKGGQQVREGQWESVGDDTALGLYDREDFDRPAKPSSPNQRAASFRKSQPPAEDDPLNGGGSSSYSRQVSMRSSQQPQPQPRTNPKPSAASQPPLVEDYYTPLEQTKDVSPRHFQHFLEQQQKAEVIRQRERKAEEYYQAMMRDRYEYEAAEQRQREAMALRERSLRQAGYAGGGYQDFSPENFYGGGAVNAARNGLRSAPARDRSISPSRAPVLAKKPPSTSSGPKPKKLTKSNTATTNQMKSATSQLPRSESAPYRSLSPPSRQPLPPPYGPSAQILYQHHLQHQQQFQDYGYHSAPPGGGPSTHAPTLLSDLDLLSQLNPSLAPPANVRRVLTTSEQAQDSLNGGRARSPPTGGTRTRPMTEYEEQLAMASAAASGPTRGPLSRLPRRGASPSLYPSELTASAETRLLANFGGPEEESLYRGSMQRASTSPARTSQFAQPSDFSYARR